MKLIIIISILFNSVLLNAQTQNVFDINDKLQMHLGDTILIKNITKEEFENQNKDDLLIFEPIQNSDSIEKELVIRYEFIDKKEDTLILNCKNNVINLFKVNSNYPQKHNTYKIYSLCGSDYLTIYESGYENWTYYIIDLNGEMVYFSPSQPSIIGDKYIYGSANYYGDFDIVVYSLTTNSKLSFTLNNLIATNDYISNNKVFIETETMLQMNNGNKRKEYFEIKINKEL